MDSEPVNLLKTLDYSVVQQCMHCGLCLPTCPTYDETGRERNSPRGRIALMRSIADDALPLDKAFAEEMDYCVGCLACTTACPADVDYAHLLETARAASEQEGLLVTPIRSFYRWLGMSVVMKNPGLMRWAAWAVSYTQKPWARSFIYKSGLIWLAPKRLRELEPKSPIIDRPFSDSRINLREQPTSKAFKKVAVLTGCVQDISYARVNRATVDVLVAAGCEVITPRNQSCCGSLHAHNGEIEQAKELARRMLDEYREDGPQPLTSFDVIISNSGGCGSHLRHYGRLLKGDTKYESIAGEWDSKLRDVQEFLHGLLESSDLPLEPARPNFRITYDASCHLVHGQKVVHQPVELLKRIPGIEFIPLAESDWCCGAAGVYAITQPDQAQKLLDRKLEHLRKTKADVLATANPGCMHHLALACKNDAQLRSLRIVHPMELLAEHLA